MRRARASNQLGNPKYPPPPSRLTTITQEDVYHHAEDDIESNYPDYFGAIQKSNLTSHMNLAKRKSHRLRRDRCIKGCAYFSFVGMAFLIFIGVLIETQPLYIKGLVKRRNLNKQNNYVLNNDYNNNRRLSQVSMATKFERFRRRLKEAQVYMESTNAFKAAFAYFCTMLGCLFLLRNNEQLTIRWARWKRRIQYREFSDNGSSYIFEGNQRHGYGTFELWRRKIVSATPGIKWFREGDKSKKR